MTFAPLVIHTGMLPSGGAGLFLSRISVHAGLEWAGARFLPEGCAGIPGGNHPGPEGRRLLVVWKGPDAIHQLWKQVQACEAMTGGRGVFTCFSEAREARDWLMTLQAAPHLLPDDVMTGEKILVLVKPDNFRGPSARPGIILDHLEKAGLFLSALKIHHFRPSEAREFYGPVLPLLRDFQGGRAAALVSDWAAGEGGLPLTTADKSAMEKQLGSLLGLRHWESLVEFMCGVPASAAGDAPGPAKVLALIYHGAGAVEKIRALQGSTDPSKAAPHSIRGELARSVMWNAIHASDSAANAYREIAILRWQDDPLAGMFAQMSRRDNAAEPKSTLTH